MLDPQLTCPDGVVYDDAAHVYTIDGVPAPSVSSVLKVVNPDQYAMIDPAVLENAAERGRDAHAMLALDCRDELDMLSLDGVLVDQYLAWCEARDRMKMTILHSERVVCSRKQRYCGTLDIIAELAYKSVRGLWLLDAKFTAQCPPLVGVQLEGYGFAAEESGLLTPGKYRKGCLWFKNGKATLIEMKNPSDRATFLAGRNVLQWREKNVH